MEWVLCIKNLAEDKFEAIPPGIPFDRDDPNFGPEAHVIPIVRDGDWLSFGYHEPSRGCACHPIVEQLHASAKFLVKHKEWVQ